MLRMRSDDYHQDDDDAEHNEEHDDENDDGDEDNDDDDDDDEHDENEYDGYDDESLPQLAGCGCHSLRVRLWYSLRAVSEHDDGALLTRLEMQRPYDANCW